MSEIIQNAAGIITVVLGLQMAFQFQNIIYLSLSLFLGGIIGNALDLDGKILGIGNFFEKLLYRKNFRSAAVPALESQNQNESKNFAYAFLNASCLFCIGAMSILGSFEAGIRGTGTADQAAQGHFGQRKEAAGSHQSGIEGDSGKIRGRPADSAGGFF